MESGDWRWAGRVVTGWKNSIFCNQSCCSFENMAVNLLHWLCVPCFPRPHASSLLLSPALPHHQMFLCSPLSPVLLPDYYSQSKNQITSAGANIFYGLWHLELSMVWPQVTVWSCALPSLPYTENRESSSNSSNTTSSTNTTTSSKAAAI